MEQVLATYRQGKIELDAPVDWADGTRIQVSMLRADPSLGKPGPNVRTRFLDALNSADPHGLDESLWPLSQEETRLLLSAMDAAEPLELSVQEIDRMESEWKASKAMQKELVRRSWEGTAELVE